MKFELNLTLSAGLLLFMSSSTMLHAALVQDHTGTASAVCSVSTQQSGRLSDARDLYTANCPTLERRDCDPLAGGGWTCASSMIGPSAPIVTAPSTSSCYVRSVASLSQARRTFAEQCVNAVLIDCDPTAIGWVCSSAVLGKRAPLRIALQQIVHGTMAPSLPLHTGSITDLPSDADRTAAIGDDDLVAMHFDTCTGSDQREAMAAAAATLDRLGHRTHLTVTGTCPAGSSGPDAARIATAAFGVDALDANADRPASVSDSADAWAAVIAAGGRVHVVANDTSGFSADVLRLVAARYPTIERAGINALQSL